MIYVLTLIGLILTICIVRGVSLWYQLTKGHETGKPFVIYFPSFFTLWCSIREFDYKSFVSEEHVSYKEDVEGYTSEIARLEEEIVAFELCSEPYRGMNKVFYCQPQGDSVAYNYLEIHRQGLEYSLGYLKGEQAIKLFMENIKNED